MAYRKRVNPVVKTCAKCKASFETWHIGRIYCSQSCNMTAWRHRHKSGLEAIETELDSKNDLSFSIPNIATIATGSLAATAAVNIFSSEPTPSEIVELIKKMSRNVGYSMGQVITRLKRAEDFYQAISEKDPGVSLRVKQITKQREQKEGLRS